LKNEKLVFIPEHLHPTTASALLSLWASFANSHRYLGSVAEERLKLSDEGCRSNWRIAQDHGVRFRTPSIFEHFSIPQQLLRF
jgi:hypothetical protein